VVFTRSTTPTLESTTSSPLLDGVLILPPTLNIGLSVTAGDPLGVNLVGSELLLKQTTTWELTLVVAGPYLLMLKLLSLF